MFNVGIVASGRSGYPIGELVQNGGFNNTSIWVRPSSVWTIGSGRASYTANNTTFANAMYQAAPLVAGQPYEVSVEIVTIQGNSELWLALGSSSDRAVFTGPGVKTATVIAGPDGRIYVHSQRISDSGQNTVIDNVSVIGPIAP